MKSSKEKAKRRRAKAHGSLICKKTKSKCIAKKSFIYTTRNKEQALLLSKNYLGENVFDFGNNRIDYIYYDDDKAVDAIRRTKNGQYDVCLDITPWIFASTDWYKFKQCEIYKYIISKKIAKTTGYKCMYIYYFVL